MSVTRYAVELEKGPQLSIVGGGEHLPSRSFCIHIPAPRWFSSSLSFIQPQIVDMPGRQDWDPKGEWESKADDANRRYPRHPTHGERVCPFTILSSHSVLHNELIKLALWSWQLSRNRIGPKSSEFKHDCGGGPEPARSTCWRISTEPAFGSAIHGSGLIQPWTGSVCRVFFCFLSACLVLHTTYTGGPRRKRPDCATCCDFGQSRCASSVLPFPSPDAPSFKYAVGPIHFLL
jgi:hypothetical protein